MSDEFFAKTVHPLMYNYISEKKYFRRNAAIAMGNSSDSSFIPFLGEADAGSRRNGLAVMWPGALGKIGGSQAKRILETSLVRETDESAKKENPCGVRRRLIDPGMICRNPWKFRGCCP